MRGHQSSPLGWAATLLIAVTYAHVLLELAAGVLALAVAVRLLLSPVRTALCGRARECGLSARRHAALVMERRPARAPDRHPTRPRS